MIVCSHAKQRYVESHEFPSPNSGSWGLTSLCQHYWSVNCVAGRCSLKAAAEETAQEVCGMGGKGRSDDILVPSKTLQYPCTADPAP